MLVIFTPCVTIAVSDSGRLYLSKEGGYGVSTRQKAEFQENSAIPQPTETTCNIFDYRILLF
jgi:hypothetical protein